MYKQTIIQYWADPHIPDDIKILTNSWKNKNLHFEHLIFNKKDASEFIKNNFTEEVYHAFLSIKLPAMEADVFRVAYILKNGGLYVDCATQCITALDQNFINNSKLILMRKWHGGIWNGFIYAKDADNHVLEEIWAEITTTLLKRKEGNILELTGPKLFERIVRTNKHNTLIFEQNNVEKTFTLVKALKHRGATHWSRMQNIEPLYHDNFHYIPKYNSIKKLRSKKIIIHMGQHATNANYIQDLLNFLGKKAYPFLYPETNRIHYSHDRIAHILAGTDKNKIDTLFQEFYVETSESTQNIIVISSELFSSFNAIKFNKQKVTRLWKRLNQLIIPFGEKKIVYTVREQAEAIEYRLSTLIEGSMCLQNINPTMMMRNPTLDYALFHAALQKYFPDAVISAQPYNFTSLRAIKVCHDLSIEIDNNETIEWKWHKKRVNTVKSILLAKILLEINHTEFEKAEKVKLKNIFRKRLPNAGDFTFLTQQDSQEIRKKFTVSNKEENIMFTKKFTTLSNIMLDDYLLDPETIQYLIHTYFPEYANNKIDNINYLVNTLLQKF